MARGDLSQPIQRVWLANSSCWVGLCLIFYSVCLGSLEGAFQCIFLMMWWDKGHVLIGCKQMVTWQAKFSSNLFQARLARFEVFNGWTMLDSKRRSINHRPCLPNKSTRANLRSSPGIPIVFFLLLPAFETIPSRFHSVPVLPENFSIATHESWVNHRLLIIDWLWLVHW